MSELVERVSDAIRKAVGQSPDFDHMARATIAEVWFYLRERGAIGADDPAIDIFHEALK